MFVGMNGRSFGPGRSSNKMKGPRAERPARPVRGTPPDVSQIGTAPVNQAAGLMPGVVPAGVNQTAQTTTPTRRSQAPQRRRPPESPRAAKEQRPTQQAPERKTRLKENKEAVLKGARKNMGISEEKRADFQQRMQAARERRANKAEQKATRPPSRKPGRQRSM